MDSGFPNGNLQPNGDNAFPLNNTAMWTAGALLNPRAASNSQANTATTGQTNGSPLPAALPSPANVQGQLNLTFQFESPDDDTPPAIFEPQPATNLAFPSNDSHIVRQHSLPALALHQNGVGLQIERMNNVQDRSDVPKPKRRRTEAEGDNPNSFGGGSHGILGEYVKSKQEEEKAENPLIGVQQQDREMKSTVDLTSGEPEVLMVEQANDANEEVCFGMIPSTNINCDKIPAPKPGMMAIGGDGYWPQVKVILRRRTNEKDRIISVYDYTRQIFGKVDSHTADYLAPLLDSALQIRTDCRIPMRRKLPGEQVGQAVSLTLKFELMIYGPRKVANSVGKYLTKRQVTLLSPPRVHQGVKVMNPHSNDGRTLAAARMFHPTAPVSTLSHPTPQVRTVEQVRNDVANIFNSLPNSEYLPEMEANELIVTPLLKHQRQALFFMTNREEDSTSNSQNELVVNSSWQRRTDQFGVEYWYNVITDQQQRERPRASRGGLLADMMGLGKTLSVLALITTTKEDALRWYEQEPIQPRAPEKKGPQAPKDFNIPRPQGLGLTQLRRNGRATLLICPLSTITNWEEQIKQHVVPQGLSYIIYHGPNRVKDVEALAKADLVITTFGSVSSELNARTRGRKPPFPLEEIGWFRIVLDEAHIIREQNTLAFKSVCRLQANRRWAVTGTPIQNKLEDLGSLLSFLRLSPFDEKSKFLQYIILPFKNADPEIVPKLRVLIDTITLRRLKDKINLPPRSDEIIRLKFSEEEQAIYDPFAKNAQDRLTALTGRNDRILGGKTYIHILRAILRLRLICAHGKDLLNEEDMKQLEGATAATAIDLDTDEEEDAKAALKEKDAYDMFYVLQQAGQNLCCRCVRQISANETQSSEAESEGQEDVLGYMNTCFHLYCPACAKSLGNGSGNGSNGEAICATCASVDKTACVEIRRTRANVEHESPSPDRNNKSTVKAVGNRYTGPHTKTRHLVEELLELKERSAQAPDEPPFKSVVFSGWTSHLDLIEIALTDAKITFTRLDGKMTRIQRTQAMDDFRENPDVQVILVSIMAGGLGLNLTSGNTAFVMEPQFNPAAEAQAIDRVHRLGQKRPVRIVRYIMENSFEEKMLELQDKKNKLASLSMDGRDKEKVMDRTEAARQRLMDLRTLFR